MHHIYSITIYSITSTHSHAHCTLSAHGDVPRLALRCAGYKGVVDLGKAGPGNFKAQVYAPQSERTQHTRL